MNKFDRVISILILLQTKNIITASTIAERFETSLRTVYRDINTLKNAGIPIIGDPGIGYSIMEGYRLPPIMFNEGEALSLLTAEKFMATITDRKTQEHYSAAMTKIKAVLRSSEKQALDILDDSISIPPEKFEEHKPYLQGIFKSIAARQLLQVFYGKADGTVSERILDPIDWLQSKVQLWIWFLQYSQESQGHYIHPFRVKNVDHGWSLNLTSLSILILFFQSIFPFRSYVFISLALFSKS